MGLFETLPYTNFHRVNMDWILQEIKALKDKIEGLDPVDLPFVTPEMFGAKGDGVTDDTSAIRRALNSGSLVFDSNKNYLVSLQGLYALNLVSNRVIYGNNSRITLKPNASGNYKIFYGNGVANILIDSLNIVGDITEHLGSGGETAECLALYGCSNIRIQNCNFSDAWGDGLRITGLYTENISVSDCSFKNCGRNGLSIEDGVNVQIDGCTFDTFDRTDPKACLDIEPYESGSRIKNVSVTNCKFENGSRRSLIVALTDVCSNADVTVKGCTSGSAYMQLYNLGTFNNIMVSDCQACTLRVAQPDPDSKITLENIRLTMTGSGYSSYRNSGLYIDVSNSHEVAPVTDVPGCYNVTGRVIVYGTATAYCPVFLYETGTGKGYKGNVLTVTALGTFTAPATAPAQVKVLLNWEQPAEKITAASGYTNALQQYMIDEDSITGGNFKLQSMFEGVRYRIRAGAIASTIYPWADSQYNFILTDGLSTRNIPANECRSFIRYGNNIYEGY